MKLVISCKNCTSVIEAQTKNKPTKIIRKSSNPEIKTRKILKKEQNPAVEVEIHYLGVKHIPERTQE